LAVFVGVNGSGKTSVLEGIVRTLKVVTDGLQPNSRDNFDTWMNEDDIRLVAHQLGSRTTFERQSTYSLETLIKWDSKEIEWHFEQSGGNNEQIREAYSEKRRQVQSGKPVELPIVSYYKSSRFWSNEKIKDIGLYPIGSRLDTYIDCLDSKVNSKVIYEWFKRMEFIHFQRKGEIPPELEAVKDALSIGLEFILNTPFGSRVYFSGELDELLVSNGKGSYFPFRLLSEGFRNTIGLIGDIAYRTAELNPHIRTDTSGIVIIDDIDLHLHPSWQRKVVPTLRHIFPNIQFILTTHSPQVISTLHKENVFILDNFHLVKETPHTYGRDSNSILYDIFGVEKRPAEAKEEFSKLYRLMDDPEKVDETASLLQDVEAKYGYYDEEVVRARGQFQFLNEA